MTQLTPIQAARAAKQELRKKAAKRFYVYHGESFLFTLAGDKKPSTIIHGDAVALSKEDVAVLRKLGKKLIDKASKEELKEVDPSATSTDIVADVETVERMLGEDNYTGAAKVARLLGLELEDQTKPTVYKALLEWLDGQKKG